MFLITSPHLTGTVCGFNSLCAYRVENVCAKKLNAVLGVMGMCHLHAQTKIQKRTWIFKFSLCCNSGTQDLSMQLIMILLRCLGKQRCLCCWGLGCCNIPFQLLDSLAAQWRFSTDSLLSISKGMPLVCVSRGKESQHCLPSDHTSHALPGALGPARSTGIRAALSQIGSGKRRRK